MDVNIFRRKGVLYIEDFAIKTTTESVTKFAQKVANWEALTGISNQDFGKVYTFIRTAKSIDELLTTLQWMEPHLLISSKDTAVYGFVWDSHLVLFLAQEYYEKVAYHLIDLEEPTDANLAFILEGLRL